MKTVHRSTVYRMFSMPLDLFHFLMLRYPLARVKAYIKQANIANSFTAYCCLDIKENTCWSVKTIPAEMTIGIF